MSKQKKTEGAWQIGPRVLPPTDGASDELREVLAGETAPQPLPQLPDNATLKAMVTKRDAATTELLESASGKLGVELKEDKVGGVPVFHVTPSEVAKEHAEHLFVHVHGGAFVLNAGIAGMTEAIEIAAWCRIPVLSIDYRMAPEHLAPAAMDDVVAVWREVIADRPEATTALGGTSAGANLTAVSTLKMKELGLALPGALMIGTLVTDMATHGDSRFLNTGVDHTLHGWEGAIHEVLELYMGDTSADDPYVSPILGDFTGFPPTYLITGTRDLFLSDVVRTHRKLRQSGVTADLHVYEGFAHADFIKQYKTPECREHYAELDAFLLKHLTA